MRLWVLALDEALAPSLPKGERRYALKEARGVLEDLSFASAWHDERFAPDDRDLGRALAALKPPDRAAAALAKRRPIYRRKRRAALVRTWSILAALVLAGYGISQIAESETSESLVTVTHSAISPETGTAESVEFVVPAGLSRLDVTVHATNLDSGGGVHVWLFGPNGTQEYDRAFTKESRVYDHANVAATPGTWRCIVDYVETKGAVRVDVRGIRPG